MRIVAPMLLALVALLPSCGSPEKPKDGGGGGPAGESQVAPPVGERLEARSNAVVAIVNDEVITQRDLELHLHFSTDYDGLESTYQDEALLRERRRLRAQSVERLIEDRVLVQEAKRQKLELDGDERRRIDDQIESEARQHGSREQLERELAMVDVTLPRYRRMREEQALSWRLEREQISSANYVTPQEIRHYYQELQSQFARDGKLDGPERRRFFFRDRVVRFRQIKLDFVSAPREEAQLALARIRADLEGGASFEDLARRYSKGPRAEQGGLFELASEDELNDAFGQALKSLEPGQLSPVVETADGLYLFLLESRAPSRLLSFDESRERIRLLIAEERVDQHLAQWKDRLIRESYIKKFEGQLAENNL